VERTSDGKPHQEPGNDRHVIETPYEQSERQERNAENRTDYA